MAPSTAPPADLRSQDSYGARALEPWEPALLGPGRWAFSAPSRGERGTL